MVKISSYDLVRPGRRWVMALITGAGITAAMAVGVPAAAMAATAAPTDLPGNCIQPGSMVYCNFYPMYSEQDFTVPAGVSTVVLTAIGAAGGSDATNAGSEGGFAVGTASVTPGAMLYVEVGGTGLNARTIPRTAAQAGGFNGGGASSAGDSTSDAPASGGGASDVRTVSSADPGTTLASRLIVAGGGGGAASCGGGGGAGYAGAYISSVTCSSGTSNGGGAGTAIAGGTSGGAPATAGVEGIGGAGGLTSASGDGGGGGGGGVYGGGGGGPQAGGGGGSSYAAGSRSFTGVASEPASVTIGYTPPALSISIAAHGPLTRDATSPAGAVVHYTSPKVTDQADPTDPPAAVCTPPSGGTFPIGTTTVTCTATDAADSNSPVSSTFTVTIVGAPGQLAALHWDVRDYGPGLANTVLIAEHAVDTENTPRACLALDAFIIEVQTRIPPLPPVTRAYLIAAAGQIQAVLACGASWLP